MDEILPEDSLEFNRSVDCMPGQLAKLSPLVRRIVAPNPGPMTFTGTCTYIIGRGKVMIVDPGPDDQTWRSALIEALKGEEITHILITHTHKDHSPNARPLSDLTGARIIGCGRHISSAPAKNAIGATAQDAANDIDHVPDWQMYEGDTIEGDGFALAAVETPGHTKNHLCFALPQEKALFSGDHVMAWSTTVVAPPDGNMSAYMGSLEKLQARDETVFWPGHGGPVNSPQRFLRGLIRHRHTRESAILARVKSGDTTIPKIVANIYRDLDPQLTGAASWSVLAHIESLLERRLLRTDSTLSLAAHYEC